MITEEAINRIADLGVAEQKPQVFADDGAHTPFMLRPGNMVLESLEKFFPPTRIAQTVTLLDPDSLADYVNRYKTEDTLLFVSVNENGARMVAVMDYHGEAPGLEAAECKHRAVFGTEQTPEWRSWLAQDRQKMTQVQFAEWLEEHERLISAGAKEEGGMSGADLLEFISNLEGKSHVNFTTQTRLQTGANKLDFDESVELKGGVASTKSGSLQLPKSIVAGIAPFQGAAVYAVRARLKFRIESRKLTLWFETVDKHKIVRDAVVACVKAVADKTKLTPFIGSLGGNS